MIHGSRPRKGLGPGPELCTGAARARELWPGLRGKRDYLMKPMFGNLSSTFCKHPHEICLEKRNLFRNGNMARMAKLFPPRGRHIYLHISAWPSPRTYQESFRNTMDYKENRTETNRIDMGLWFSSWPKSTRRSLRPIFPTSRNRALGELQNIIIVFASRCPSGQWRSASLAPREHFSEQVFSYRRHSHWLSI